MSDLPSRDEINKRIGGLGTGRLTGEWAVAGAYGLGELKTEAEWREAIDYEAAAKAYLFATDPIPPRNWSDLSFVEKQTKLAVARAIMRAAVGDTDDNGCLLCGEDVVHSGPHYYGDTG